MSETPQAWLVRLAVHKAEVVMTEAKLAALDPDATISAYCPDDDNAPDDWLVDIYLSEAPSAAVLAAAGIQAAPEPVYAADWVSMSQDGLDPIRAGRFRVVTPESRHAVRPGDIALVIPAGRAFGTGHHHTTWGCLLALQGLAKAGVRPHRVLDVGTGTGILAFAAARLWPCQVRAGDIDSEAVAVARDNLPLSGLSHGLGRRQVALWTAPGARHPALRAGTPYSIVIANILAKPLLLLSQDLTTLTAPGGYLLLAGLLAEQQATIVARYRALGFRLVRVIRRGEWPTLVLRRTGKLGIARVKR
jgi:ribosomal protein L11 methyltransferase